MPNSVSAKKRVRQDADRTVRNKERRSRVRSTTRRLREAVEAGDKATAQATLIEAYQAIDKASKHNVMHDNAAANKKSNLTRLVRTLG